MENFYHWPIYQKALVVVLTSFILMLLIGRVGIKILRLLKIGQPIRYENFATLSSLHASKKDTPTMGGIFFLAIFFILSFFLLDFHQSMSFIYLIGFLFLGLLGGYDDYRKLKGIPGQGISSKTKFLLQGLIGVLILSTVFVFDRAVFEKFFCHFGLSTVGIFLSCLFFLFIFIGSSNAVNLTDGLDGLAAGNIAIVATALLSIFFIKGSSFENYSQSFFLLCIMIGTSLGFLWYNQFPAQVFMGDTGSLSLGGLLALVAFTMKKEWIFALFGICFIGETLSVILQVASYRLRNKKKLFLCTPIHHHFQFLGMHETQIVVRFWLVSIIFCLIGLSLV